MDPFIVTSHETKAVMDEIVENLENDLKQTWKQVQQNENFEEITAFGEKLEEFGQRHSLDVITRYGRNLITHSNCFDVERIEEALDAYPILVDKLKQSRDF